MPEKSSAAPPPLAILAVYVVLGGVVSFVFGRDPGAELPQNIHRELAPTLLVVCGFITSYSLWDVMAVGVAKTKAKFMDKSYGDMPDKWPEAVYLAVRVQTNQVEQMPGFLVGSLSCAVFVNGSVAAVLALIWVILRRCYAATYRGAVGVPMKDMGLSRFTIPAYFISNTLLMSSAVHALRCILSTY